MILRGLKSSAFVFFTLLLGAASAAATPAPRTGMPVTEAASWTPRTGDGLQPARAGASAVFDVARNRVIVFGGGAGALRNDTWALDLSTGRWTQLATTGVLPTPRQWHSATLDATGHMIVYGGWDGRHLSDMYSLDLTTLVWRRMTVSSRSALLAPLRYQHSATLVATSQDTSIYIFGGYDGDSLSNAVYRYVLGARDTRNVGTWNFFATVANTKPPSRRGGATLVVDYAPTDTFLVVFGGTDGTRYFSSGGRLSLSSGEWDTSFVSVTVRPSIRAAQAAAVDPASRTLVVFGGWNGTAYLSDVWTLPLGGTTPLTWTQRTTSGAAPDGRAFTAATAANGKLVIAGGTTATGLTADAWSLPLAGGDWEATAVNAAPSARYGHALVFDTVRNKNMLYGGSSSYNQYLSDIWQFDAATGAWTQLTVVPPAVGENTHRARFRPAVAYVGGSHDALYAFGGYSGVYDDTMWVYSPTAGTWRKTATLGPTKREGATLTYDAPRDRLVLFGGFNGSYLSDLWSFDLTTETWTALPSLLGAGRSGHAAVVTSSGLLAIVGGRGSSGLLDEIRTFDLTDPAPTSSSWALVTDTGQRPLPRSWAAVAPLGSTAYLYGGAGPDVNATSNTLLGIAYGDTVFALDTSSFTWSVAGNGLAVGPGTRFLSAMAPTSVAGQIVLFGGGSGSSFGDTWTLSTSGGSAPSATASVMADGRVAVRWKIDDVAPPAGYTLLRASALGSDESVVAVVPSTALPSADGWMEAYDASPASGQTYHYTVLDLGTGERVVTSDVTVPAVTFAGIPHVALRTPTSVPVGIVFFAPNVIGSGTAPTREPEAIVFDLAGRAVRRIALAHDGANRYAATWDGRDTSGRTAPSGIYLLRATGDYGHIATGRVVLTR